MNTHFRVFVSLLICIGFFITAGAFYHRDEKKTVVIAFAKNKFAGVNINDAKAAVEMWAKVISKKREFSFNLSSEILEDQAEIEKALEDRKLDYMNISTIDYLKLHKKGLVDPFVVSVRGGKVLEEFVLLVNEDSGIKDLGQLKDKKLIIIKGSKGQLGKLWLDTFLLKKGLLPIQKLFSGIKEVGEASDAILPVYFRQQDACLVTYNAFNTMVDLNPKVGKKLRTLATSPELLIDITCYSKALYDERVRRELMDSALSLHKDPDGRQVLLLFRVDRLDVYKPSYLENVAELYREHISLTKGK